MSLLQSPTTRTTVEQKIKARNCALLLKNGSPKLRDLLRVQCRSRMRDSRADAFANTRNIQTERTQLIHRIVKEELSNELENDIELQDIILKEILENFEQWQQEEYEKELESMDFNDEDSVICPVCEYHVLTLAENIISCDCGLRLYYSKSLPEFKEKIFSTCQLHEKSTGCGEKMTFFLEPRHGFKVLALNSICYTCDFFSSIVELI